MSTRTPEIHQATASQIQTSHTILALDRPAQLAHGGEAVSSPLQQIPNEQDEIIDEVIMALGLGERSSMGCAYFSTADATLHVAEDVSMATLEVADQFISQIEPTTLLVSARAPRFMLDFLEAKVESQLDTEPNGFILRALGSQDFSYASAIDRLATLEFDRFSHVGAVVTTSNERQSTSHDSGIHRRDDASESTCTKALRCGSFINLDSHASVCYGFS
jgi:DNA mismatch repair protein MSH5